MARCAYCNEEKILTREHIIPSFAYDFQKSLSESITGWNEKAEKMLPSEAQIKDVCATCNNIILGKLDDEGKRLLSDSGVLTYNFQQPSIRLNFDFDLLARWLLKISFNSSRTDGIHAYIFEPHIDYMLHGVNRIQRSKIAILSYFAAPEILDNEERLKEPYKSLVGSSNALNPFLVRICYGYTAGTRNYTLRMVIFGPLVFFLLVFNDGILPGHAASEIRQFIKRNPGAVELGPKLKFVQMKPGQQTWLDLYQDQIMRLKNKKPSNALWVKNQGKSNATY